MAELTISSDEIRSAIANYTSSYSAEASREEVGVVISAADGIAALAADSPLPHPDDVEVVII